MHEETPFVSEYRPRQLRVAIIELFAVTTAIAVLCALGNGGVVTAVFVGTTGTICRLLSRTWVGWIVGPFMGLLAGLIGLPINVFVGLGFALLSAAVMGWHMGNDRFYREYASWRHEKEAEDDA